ncbi:GTPase [Bacillus anthracis]|uniref:dynamin family protein n=1 Tax=Bacillus TaxID=1386 RepID=UPI001926509D|nr:MULTISPECIES: dynamin family protein [Bacillus]MBL3849953.1 dynamin family protein [Bacillus cereus]MDR4407256.1 GTPase [Bacillus anthracis]MEC3857893.1 dynamin family protein [Bacillus sp. WOD8 KX774193]
MTTIFLKYNPYKVETVVTIDGEPIKEDSYLAQFKNERLQLWIDQFIERLIDELNEDTFSLNFEGTQFDFEDVEEACAKYNAEHNAGVTVSYTASENSNNKIDELKELFEYMQEGPFEDLKSNGIRRNFDKALSSDFEIAVVATMSSGKSTLINSLLGTELMPAKNEACTATIATIKNTEQKDLLGRCLNHEQEEIEEWQELNLEVMERFNNNEEVSDIEIKANIPNISSGKMNLVLVDTPGPNNSRNSAHRDHTYRVIKNDTKPMVLYVLNATQLGIQDDNDLLNTVAEQMKSGGKQSKDRFIFAVNKIDEFDTEAGESVSKTIREVREYLEEKGIENPNIFPVSALMAKLIRMDQNGHKLTKKQKSVLREHDLFIEEDELNLLKHAPLSEKRKENLYEKVQVAKDEEDTYQEALMYSGVPSIEEAINEYLEKYAVTSKITTAVNSFKDVVEAKRLEQNLKTELVSNEQKRIDIHEQMKKLNEEIDKGNRAQQFKERIKRKQYDHHDIIQRIEGKIERKIDDMVDIFIDKQRIEEYEANKLIERLKEDIKSLQSDIKTDLELIILMVLKNDANALLEEYKGYVQDLIEVSGNALSTEEFSIFFLEMPNAESIVQDISYDDSVITGEKWVSTSKWYNPFSWGDGYNKNVYSTKTFVNVSDIAENVLYPAKTNLYDNIECARSYLQNEEQSLKIYFNNEIDRLENLLKQKVEEIEMLSGDSEVIKEKLVEDKVKYEWLQDFQIRLNNILEI